MNGMLTIYRRELAGLFLAFRFLLLAPAETLPIYTARLGVHILQNAAADLLFLFGGSGASAAALGVAALLVALLAAGP